VGLAVLTAAALAIVPASASAVTLTPSSADYGNQAVGTTSAPKTFTIALEAGDFAFLTDVSVSGNFAQTNDCGLLISFTDSACTINVTFTPSALGPRQGVLKGDAMMFGGLTATLQGTGVPAPVPPAAPATAQAATPIKKCKRKKAKKAETSKKKCARKKR